jgi:NTP pyrophosphatase (non-canonical NTP hydrolase)
MSMSIEDLRAFQHYVGSWGDATFPQSTTETVLNHLTEEVLELRGVPKETIPDIMNVINAYANRAYDQNDAEEGADVFLLLLHFCHKLGYDLAEEAAKKMEKNELRVWSKEPEAVGGHFKHVDEDVETTTMVNDIKVSVDEALVNARRLQKAMGISNGR